MTIRPLIAIPAAALILGACATTGSSVAEKTPGKFVTYQCEDKKSFQVRFDAELGTARIRTHEGSAELARGDRGLFRDDMGQWILALGDGKNTELVHQGKAKYKNCSAS